MARVLYISYDGLLDPLGQSQVLPYLEGLSARGHRFHLITFEKPARWADADAQVRARARLAAAEIAWHPLPYHKRPPVGGTLRDLLAGTRLGAGLGRPAPFDLVHARSYPSSLIALRLHRATGAPFVFDMRGFYPEERVDGGLWRGGGLLFQVAKRLERDFLREAAGVVTLTRASLPVLEGAMDAAGSRAALRCIPTCVDLDRFALRPPPTGPFRLMYLGSIGTWYLLDPMMAFARSVLDRVEGGIVEFVVNGEEEAVRAAAARQGIPDGHLRVGGVPHEQVPEALARATATFFLIRPGGSKISSAATKFGESLAVGRPVAANPGVGDTAGVIEADGVGVVVRSVEGRDHGAAAQALVALAGDPEVAARCRRSAETRYALSAGVDAYADLYAEILEGER